MGYYSQVFKAREGVFLQNLQLTISPLITCRAANQSIVSPVFADHARATYVEGKLSEEE